MPAMIPVTFVGGERGQWRVERVSAVSGAPLAAVPALQVEPSHLAAPPATPHAWLLRGSFGHSRYVERAEKAALTAVQAGLGRPEARCAALIPIKKSEAWWELAQDERRAIFEQESRHIAASLKYLPAIARRLYQSRDLGEPFDFLTWFEYAPEHAVLFEELVALLRATREWQFVEREVDLRLQRA